MKSEAIPQYQVIKKPQLSIAGYEIFSVPTGQFGLDGGAMFGTVPKVLWAKTNPPDEQNRIPMEARALLLKGHDRVILIDTGNGSDFVEKYGEKVGSKFASMYGVDSGKASLELSLQNLGIQPEDVTDVILTHLHFDHAGGAVKFNPNTQQLVPTFPNASYRIRKANLETAQKPNLREKASYLPANFEPLLSAGVLKVLDENESLGLPNLNFFISNGHTRGQQIIWVCDQQAEESGAGLIYCADLVPTSSHVRLPWVMGYDLEPLRLIDEKSEVLGMAADKEWYLFFEHDPYCDIAKIKRDGQDFKVTERFFIEPRSV